jgi:hypothetical protein
MEDELAGELAKAFGRGRPPGASALSPSDAFEMGTMDVKSIRKRLGMVQAEFAVAISVSWAPCAAGSRAFARPRDLPQQPHERPPG